MLGSLWHAPKPKSDDEKEQPLGASTIGSSEACMLGGLALKRRWQVARKKAGKPTDKPNLVLGANAQVSPPPSKFQQAKPPSQQPSHMLLQRLWLALCSFHGRCQKGLMMQQSLSPHAALLRGMEPAHLRCNAWKDVCIAYLTCAAPQVCWEKFCEYWDVEGRYVPVTKDYPVSVQAVSDLNSLISISKTCHVHLSAAHDMRAC